MSDFDATFFGPGFEAFVGSKTTFRILNSPDASWPKDGDEATLMTLRTHEQVRKDRGTIN
jgi:hypothetical protein